MNIKQFFKYNWTLVVYFILAIFSILPFLNSGFFQIHDDVQVARIYEMGKSLSMGMFPVRWVMDLGYGFGYPIFNFYSVLPYYLGGSLTLVGIDSLIATKIIFILVIISSGVSMYFLARSFFGQVPALVAGVLYLYFPYHAVNIYIRGDLAELSAYVFLPLVLLSFFRIYVTQKIDKKYILLGTLSLSGVILSHNLTAFMLFIILGLFAIYSLIFGKEKKNIFLSYVLIFGISFLLSAFYAIPATLESQLTNVLTQVGGGADFKNNFVCLSQLWDSPWGFGGSIAGCVDGLSFRLGKPYILFAIIAIIASVFYLQKLKEKNFVVIFTIMSLILSIFMTLSYSAFLWNLPFMDFLQYPWRFLNFTGLFISLLIGFLAWLVKEKFGEKLGIISAFVIIGITMFMTIKLFTPQNYLKRDVNYYTNKYYLNWTASIISDEYLPKGFKRPQSFKEVSDYKLNYNNSLYKISGRSSKPRFSFEQTNIQKVANILSIIGVLALIAVIIVKFGNQTKREENT